MRPSRLIVLSIFAASLATSLVASAAFGKRPALWFGIPALVISTWAAMGHLVTLDDDAPGGWSNPDGATQFRYRSLRELALKVAVALLVAWLVVGAPSAQRAA